MVIRVISDGGCGFMFQDNYGHVNVFDVHYTLNFFSTLSISFFDIFRYISDLQIQTLF